VDTSWFAWERASAYDLDRVRIVRPEELASFEATGRPARSTRRSPACRGWSETPDTPQRDERDLWNDWDDTGLLLSATVDGRLHAHEVGGSERRIVFDLDLADLEPAPTEPPAWALEW
jgi:hypothetical protein